MTIHELHDLIESNKNTPSTKQLAEAFSWTDAVKGAPFRGSGSAQGYKYAPNTLPNTFDKLAAGVNERDNELAQAKNTKPFPLDRLGDQLTSAFMHLLNAKNILLQAYKSGLLNTAERQTIKQKISVVNKLLESTKKLGD